MRILTLLLIGSQIVASSELPAQGRTYWRIPSAVAGGMLGAGAGYAIDLARWNAEGCSLCGPSLTMTPIGIGVGAGIGFLGGLNADQTLRRGDTLSVARRGWLRAATFFTPPALGSALAFLVINPSEACVPNPEGGCTEETKVADDEVVLLLGIGGGTMLGYMLHNKTRGALHPRVTAGARSLGLSFTYAF